MKRLVIALAAFGSLAACDAAPALLTAPERPDLSAGGFCTFPTYENAVYLTAHDPAILMDEDFRSTFQEGDPLVNITFVNGTCAPVNVYWLNYQGEMELYNTLKGGESYVQRSYIGHPWVVTTKLTTNMNRVLAVFGPTNTGGVALIQDLTRESGGQTPPIAGRPTNGNGNFPSPPRSPRSKGNPWPTF